MKTFRIYIGLLLASLLVLASCKEDKIVDNPSGETFIYGLRVVNGDITGAGRFDGVVDEATKTITFTIPAESDIEHIKFEGKLSLGAKLDAESYNFLSNLTQKIRIVNVENSADYTVKVSLSAAVSTPYVSNVIVTLSDGKEAEAFISMIEKKIYLNAPLETEVTIKEVSVKPIRANKTFTQLVGSNKLTSANPGKLKLEFMGLTDEFDLSFAKTPQYGADFSLGLIYDFSANTGGNPVEQSIYPDFAAENTRSADFDGKHVLVVSRQGGNIPKLFTLGDITAGNTASPTVINMTGVTGGTYIISSGRLAQGHIYICNLTTGIASGAATQLKIYHWSTASAVPNMIVDFNGTLPGGNAVGRYGDNMSVNLDASGNGYIYLVEHVSGTQILRFKVDGFTSISESTVLVAPVAASYYGSYNQVDGSDNEYLYTSTKAILTLVDKDGKDLLKMKDTSVPIRGTDARIINFNFERYLIMTTGCVGTVDGPPTLYVYNLTKGVSTVDALTEFEKGDKTPLFSYPLSTTAITAAAHSASSGWGIANGKLYIFGAAPKVGFAVFEFPKKN